MTNQARRSWQAFARPLSDNALQALLRGLRGNDERIAANGPVIYALRHGDGLDGTPLLARLDVIHLQASRELEHELMAVTEWLNWFDSVPQEEAYALLASEVAEELERRSRRGAVQVSVC